MTTLVGHGFTRPFRLRRLVGGLAIGIALAALTGVAASRLVAPDSASEMPASVVVEAGPARLAMPAAWQPVARDERSAGLDSKQLAVLSRSSDLSTMVFVTFGAPDEGSLIPRALGELAHTPRSEPRVTSLGGRPAWVYRGVDARRWNLVMDVTVLPTTAGMLALACASPAPSGDAGPGCAAAVKSVSVRGVAALESSPTVALAAQLPAMLAGLDEARVDGRAALTRARTREAQAVALQSLAGRHGAAADRLRTEFGTAARPLIAGLEDSRRAYAALATAASDGSPARYVAARRQVRVAEGELGVAIDRTRRAGARDTAAAAPPSPAATVTEPARPLVTQPILLILLLLGSCAAGFALTGPLADAIAKLRRAVSAP
jgi:hypothetical protein